MKLCHKMQRVWPVFTFYVASTFYSKSYKYNCNDVETLGILSWHHWLALCIIWWQWQSIYYDSHMVGRIYDTPHRKEDILEAVGERFNDDNLSILIHMHPPYSNLDTQKTGREGNSVQLHKVQMVHVIPVDHKSSLLCRECMMIQRLPVQPLESISKHILEKCRLLFNDAKV